MLPTKNVPIQMKMLVKEKNYQSWHSEEPSMAEPSDAFPALILAAVSR